MASLNGLVSSHRMVQMNEDQVYRRGYPGKELDILQTVQVFHLPLLIQNMRKLKRQKEKDKMERLDNQFENPILILFLHFSC